MKKLLVFATIVASGSAFASAGNHFSLMEVTKHSGFVPAHLAHSLHCTIGNDGVLVKWSTGTSGKQNVKYNPTKYTNEVSNELVALELLKKAAKGGLSTDAGPTCGPMNTYTGIIEGPVVSKHIKLFQSGMKIGKNTAEGVDQLIEFGNVNCQFPAENEDSEE